MSPNRSAVFYRDLNTVPPTIVRGEGIYLEDSTGRRYLDANGSAGVVGIGHGRTEIAKALAEAGDRLTFVYNATFTHPWQEDLARAILGIAPANMAGVYFVSGGSEANESAWKLARQYFVERGRPQKYKAIARQHSYHGVTLATLSLSGRPSWKQIYSPMLLPVAHIAPPYEYRCGFCRERGGCTLQCADDLELAIRREGPETVAAFFAEPIVGTTATGLTPHADYYKRVREICDRYDVLFVADEVLCGYGRTGRPFAIGSWNVEPDVITMGKAIASGYAPLGAILVAEKIRAVFADGTGRFVHGLTFSGTPSSCAAGLKVFEIMQRENLFRRPGAIGAVLRSKLEGLAERHQTIGDIRGQGLLLGLEFVADRKTRQPFAKEFGFTARLVRALRERNMLVGAGVPGINAGDDGDHIQISPPYIISEDDVEKLVSILGDALGEVTRQI
jgi:adenosylmethionine-8-amino-7-oxononanoate aminotransferase